ncbi:MAG: RNA polymerase factor sigma-54 [Methylococcales bacterium]|nr:RNA polymerase factor sigma-54 [Methylococcales bacterium]
MKQSLQLGMSQQLTMTPQLQQAIKLLQLSTLDLQQEIQQALDSNMMLEEEEESLKSDLSANEKKETADEVNVEALSTDIPEELPTDSTWDDIYDSQATPTTQSSIAETPDFEAQQSKAETLHEHLLWQLELCPLSAKDHAVAIAIIDAVNQNGHLSISPEEIYQGLNKQIDDLEFDELMAVLHQIQNFEPTGVAAVNLSDCLDLQLRALPPSTPYKESALELVRHHLDLLAAQEKVKLIKKLKLTEIQLEQVIALIRNLDPKPGTQIQSVDLGYVIPDIFVTKRKNKWLVDLNPDIAPRLKINPFYSGMIKRADNSRDNTHMKEHLQEAKWFIKSLQGRNNTLLRVAKCIIEKQTEFLEYGAIAMKPMVLRNIADELELHESTISRVTTQKYMHTPNGIVEFKYFFSSHVATVEGGECSATAIRAFIKELIANERLSKPLSDEKISGILKEKGIKVARRTVAKYREAMAIASSSQRKRLL